MASQISELELEVPPLVDGERLTLDEFERRWDAMPEVKKAELLEGVVYMPPAALSMDHGAPHFNLVGWLGLYAMLTKGVGGADNASLRFDNANMPEPDALLRILETHGGKSWIGPKRVLEGAPELLAEISVTSKKVDLGIKLPIYERKGIQEYIVWRVKDKALDWFVLREGKYEPLPPGPDGLIRSRVFPGLWLDPAALIAEDSAQLLAAARLGHGSPEHCAFIGDLQRRAAGNVE